ncbi:unnamed protein product, partial [Gongylonema pulchrum]|uniref:Lysozyme n=1 Tax=Gongylonema pulchrum TaxID=637853 RepID=A0A183EDX5_9BILA
MKQQLTGSALHLLLMERRGVMAGCASCQCCPRFEPLQTAYILLEFRLQASVRRPVIQFYLPPVKLNCITLDFISLLFHLVLLLFIYSMQVASLICVNYHKYYEDGKLRLINRGTCGASNGFCVAVKFWDKDPRRKRGISLGCDRIDCEHFQEPGYGWDSNGCRKDRYLGSDGQ